METPHRNVRCLTVNEATDAAVNALHIELHLELVLIESARVISYENKLLIP